MLFRTRDLLVHQRTQLINALRAHLTEYGSVDPKKRVNLKRLSEVLEYPENGLPSMVIELGHVYLNQIAALTEQIGGLEKQLRTETAHDETARRLQTIPAL